MCLSELLLEAQGLCVYMCLSELLLELLHTWVCVYLRELLLGSLVLPPSWSPAGRPLSESREVHPTSHHHVLSCVCVCVCACVL